MGCYSMVALAHVALTEVTVLTEEVDALLELDTMPELALRIDPAKAVEFGLRLRSLSC